MFNGAVAWFVANGMQETGMKAAEWKAAAPGVWQTQIGRRDHPTLTEAAQSKPKLDRLRLLPNAKLPFQLAEIQAQTTPDFSAVRLPLQPGERIFGLGLQMVGSDRRGGVYHLRVDHYDRGHDRLHAPTPLYVSSLGYAVFFDTSRAIDVYVGVGNRLGDPGNPKVRDRNTDPHWDAQPDSGHVEASVEGAGLQVVVMAGPTAMEALRRGNLFFGGGAMPPEWALGFWHRTPLKADAQEVESEVSEFARRGFPLDVIGLEPGWQSRSYPGSMEWSPDRFPDPQGFVTSLADRGVHVNLWENPYVAPGTDLFQRLQGKFGSHTVWLGAVPDIDDPVAAATIRAFHHDHHLSLGVSGYKIDEVDGFDNWLWPDHATFPSGPSGLQMRQIYGVLWQRELYRMFHEANRRTFGLVRGSNGAATRFPFAIYSDTYDHRQYITALTNSSLAGVLWCAEIRSADNGPEWVRRMQSACLSPIAQLNAWDSGLKPWSFPDVEAAVRKAMRLRESLVPYLYTAFAQYARDGKPPVRPMCLVDGGGETDQYMLGDDLLVAPMFAGESSRKVRLPKGRWFDYETGALIGDGESITVSPGLDRMPLYVRDGALIPTFQDADNVADGRKASAYAVRAYGTGPWHGDLYEDDGDSFAYEKGEFGLFDLSLVDGQVTAVRRDGKWLHVSKPTGVVTVSRAKD